MPTWAASWPSPVGRRVAGNSDGHADGANDCGDGEVLATVRHRPPVINFDKVREIAAGSWLCSAQAARRELGFTVGVAAHRAAAANDRMVLSRRMVVRASHENREVTMPEGKIFVTGATGFIGERLVQKLVEQGQRVRSTTRRDEAADAAGIRRTRRLSLALRRRRTGPRRHRRSRFAPPRHGRVRPGLPFGRLRQESGPRPPDFLPDERGRMRNVFRVAKELGVARVVWTSTCVTLGPTPPGVTADESTPRFTSRAISPSTKKRNRSPSKKPCKWRPMVFQWSSSIPRGCTDREISPKAIRPPA